MPLRIDQESKARLRLPLVGAQLSTAGGWSQVPGRAAAIGTEVVQVFSSNPRVWPTAPPDPEALAALSRALLLQGQPLFIHAVYLINPASPDTELRERSAAALAHALATGSLAGAQGVVTHLGSHRGEGFDKAIPWLTETLIAACAQARSSAEDMGLEVVPLPTLLLETGAGSGATVGGRLEELETLIELLKDPPPGDPPPQVGLCLDTAHMFAAGYALHTVRGLSDLAEELALRGLLDIVGLVHLNDSASLFDSRRDRHANPGEGQIGYAGLAGVVRHPALSRVPFVLEVPGSEGHGPGSAELATVKTMRRAAPGQPALPGGP